MDNPSPAFLLFNHELVEATAPWCTWLDNLELAMLLLAQPGIAGEGLRRSQMEQELVRLGSNLPLGAVYFQRVNRCAAVLERRGQMCSLGSGRSRRFQTTTEGLAAMLLNLQVLRSDPTIDGDEFELKRALVSLWNLVVEGVYGRASEEAPDPASDALYRELSQLELWGHRVITDQVVADAFDVMRLIRTQRDEVEQLRAQAEARGEAASRQLELLSAARGQASSPRGQSPAETLAAAREIAAGAAPKLEATTAVLRYRAYLSYLDELGAVYEAEAAADQPQEKSIEREPS